MPELHVVDGPIGHDYLDFEPWQIAALLIRGVGEIAEWIIENDEPATKPQGYRSTSWVESSESTDGYALLVSRPKLVETNFGGYNILARIFHIEDLKKQTTVPKSPIFMSTADTQPINALEEVVESFTPHDMLVAIKMAAKIREATSHNDYHSDLNPKVSAALIVEHLDLLAETFPGASEA